MFHAHSGSLADEQVESATERVLKLSAAESYHSKEESAALGWLAKAFDLERFNLNTDARETPDERSQSGDPGFQVNVFNNSASVNSRVLSDARAFHIDAQKLLFSLIRFDFLKNEGSDIDFEKLMAEDPTPAQAKQTTLGNLRSIVIDSSPAPKSLSISLKDSSKQLQKTGKAVPNPEADQERYRVNGGAARMEVLEKLFMTFEDLKDNPPKITGKILLKEKGFAQGQEYQIRWPALDSSEILVKESEALAARGRRYSSTTIGFVSKASAQLFKSDLYMYKLNPSLLRKSITPLLVEPKFLDSSREDLNLRLLLNPKFREALLKVDLKVLTRARPSAPRVSGMRAQTVADGLETRLSPVDFGQEMSWKAKVGLDSGNTVEGIWLVAHFGKTLFPQLLPEVLVRVREDVRGFSEGELKTVVRDQRLIFEYQRKLVSF